MKKKLSATLLKVGLLAALAVSFPAIQAPSSYCYAYGDDPIQDTSKSKPKQGPKQEEPKKEESKTPADVVIELLMWLLT